MSTISSRLAPSVLKSIFQIVSETEPWKLDFDGCIKFIELVQILKPTIILSLPDDADPTLPPSRLQRSVHEFLGKCLALDHEDMKLAWHILSPLAWELDPKDNGLHIFAQRHIQAFLDYGIPHGIAFYHFFPPTTHCLDPGCTMKHKSTSTNTVIRRKLVGELSVSVTVFTQEFGPIPGISTSLCCRECKTRYYSNYWVNQTDSTRTHYHGVPVFLHVAEAVYIQAHVLQLFTTMMLTSWTSASNCARIYNDGIASNALSFSLPAVYTKSFTLDEEDVWNGLFLYWLLEDKEELKESLILLHDAPSQAKRLQPALRARNLRMAGPGQEAWNHVCDLCCWFDERPDGQKTFLRSTVTDGVTIGRPTCSVHDCDIPLQSVKHRYCPTHVNEDKICVVTTCTNLADEGHRTCQIEDHRALEDYNSIQNKAMFQLKLRLARLKTSQPRESIPQIPRDGNAGIAGFGDEEVTIDANGVCEGKSDEGNKTLRARFGRKRTHNEELCVASCGVILGRATFYGSEAPNGVRTFWKTLFPTKASLPGVLWHDNNCRIVAMLNAENDTYFSTSALPVDVFHFKCKHKEKDEQCNMFCNPARWPELCTPDGRWRFNSSAAEQANAWIGGYQSIVREMQADRYEFFLDELIKRWNRNVIKELRRKGKGPHEIPRDDLLRPDTPVTFDP